MSTFESMFKPFWKIDDYFDPIWTDDGWRLKSKKTKKLYSYRDFLVLNKSGMYGYYAVTHEHHLNVTEKYPTFSVFYLYWLESMMLLEATEKAENARLFYIDNIDKNLPPKELTKEMKKSEKIYQEGFESYYKNFEEM